jgi:hypothetical protein
MLMPVVRRNPNRSRKFDEVTSNTTIRKIKRLRDGAVKNSDELSAARLVAKGTHAYADGGPDHSTLIIKNNRFVDKMNAPSEIVPLAKVPQLEVEGNKDPYLGPVRNLRSDRNADSSKTATLPPKPDRNVTKRSDIPKAKLDYMIKTSVANPTMTETSKGAGTLKGIMDKVRSERRSK